MESSDLSLSAGQLVLLLLWAAALPFICPKLFRWHEKAFAQKKKAPPVDRKGE